jgi:medium-chain acyl-[acyl-carrier-protein] hydrolase
MTRLLPLAEAIAGELALYLDRPFALFGHSMGAILSFEVARLLRRSHAVEPAHLFVSGRRAPQLRDDTPATYQLPEDQFIADLRRINGTAPEVLEHEELMELMLPLLRADFEVCQTYRYSPGPPLSCRVTAFCGLRDTEETCERVAAWGEQTTAPFSLKKFSGDHFFVNHATPKIIEVIARELDPVM